MNNNYNNRFRFAPSMSVITSSESNQRIDTLSTSVIGVRSMNKNRFLAISPTEQIHQKLLDIKQKQKRMLNF